ncbi:MAG: hypothetical protein AAGC64_09705 [Bacteroidota bacterium]
MGVTQKILIGLVILLILVNVASIGFIWKNRPFSPDLPLSLPFRPENFFEKQIDFDDQQLILFRALMIEHKIRMDELQLEIRQLNKDLHETIILEKPSEEKLVSLQMDSLALLIKQEIIAHIKSVAGICNPNQKLQLLEALNNLPDRKGNKGNKKKKRKRQKKERLKN